MYIIFYVNTNCIYYDTLNNNIYKHIKKKKSNFVYIILWCNNLYII